MEGGRRDGETNKRVDGVVKCELGHSRCPGNRSGPSGPPTLRVPYFF